MVIEEFLRNHYLKAFGFAKKRLEVGQEATANFEYGVEEEEEYYYDEEEPPAEEEKKQPVVTN